MRKMEGNNNPWKLSIPIDRLVNFLQLYNFIHSTDFSTYMRTTEKRSYLKDPFELILDGPNLLLLKDNVGHISTELNDLSLISVIAYTTLNEHDQNGLHEFTQDPVEYLNKLLKSSGPESANIFLEKVQDILWNFKIFRQNSE